MKHLIVNADDYCRTPSISKGIRHAHLHGIVTTTTAMMNYPTAQDDLRIAMAECPQLGLGVHLTLTAGRPVLPAAQVPTLVGSDGAFLKLDQLTSAYPRVKPDELRAEWRSQIEKFLATGATLDHLDSHHHSSYFTEAAFGIMLSLAEEYNAPVRKPHAIDSTLGVPDFGPRLLSDRMVRTTDHFIISFYDDGVSLEHLLNLLNSLQEGVTELMSHPGYVDDEILQNSSYNRQREQEIVVIAHPDVKRAVQANHISLLTFRAALQPEAGRPD